MRVIFCSLIGVRAKSRSRYIMRADCCPKLYIKRNKIKNQPLKESIVPLLNLDAMASFSGFVW
uniref:Uncharacterized protein n=1 Tax=Arundo donax TaxID=35708 RepID=A0A0A9FPV1_ARUDO